MKICMGPQSRLLNFWKFQEELDQERGTLLTSKIQTRQCFNKAACDRWLLGYAKISVSGRTALRSDLPSLLDPKKY